MIRFASRRTLSRRRLLVAGGAGLLLAACQPAVVPMPTSVPAPPTSTSAPAPATSTPAPARKASSLTVYSGRTESLVGPLLEQYKTDSGVEVKTRFGDTAELAAAILEEGQNSPADVFFAQDAGALGAVAADSRLVALPEGILKAVEERFRSPTGNWVGISGRARVMNYNSEKVAESELPDSVHGLTEPRWKDLIGWAPTNGSFQSFVTAMRLVEGDAATKSWLEAMKANGVRDYRNNTAQVEATGTGEIHVSLPNHYYVYSFYRDRGEQFPARNYHPRGGGPDAMVNVAGAGILASSANREAAEHFVVYLLSGSAQKYFAEKTFEYPLSAGVQPAVQLKPLSEIKTPAIDLGNLADLKATLKLLQEAGVL